MDAKTIIMQEELISYKTAVLAKEKGFKAPCYYWYNQNGYMIERGLEVDDDDVCISITNISNQTDIHVEHYNATSQSLLQRWLKEVHRIHITIYILNKEYWCNIRIIDNEDRILFISDNYKTYEETLENGLFEALKLVKL